MNSNTTKEDGLQYGERGSQSIRIQLWMDRSKPLC